MTLKEKLSLIKFASKAKVLAPLLNKAQGGARLLAAPAIKRLEDVGSTARTLSKPTTKLKAVAGKQKLLPQTNWVGGTQKKPTPPPSTTAETTLTPNTMEKHKMLKYLLGSTPANAAVR